MTEDEMVGWHHQHNGHEFEKTPGDSEGQGSLVHCSLWGRKEPDTTTTLKEKTPNTVSESRLVMSDSLRPVDCRPPSSSVHGILQARILEWVAISFSRGSSQPRDRTQVSHIAGRLFNLCKPGKPRDLLKDVIIIFITSTIV